MRKRSYGYYRHIRTTAERKASQEGWSRAKRNHKNLPSDWDDCRIAHTNSWKDKRKTQYYPDGRGKQHEVVIEDKYHDWQIQQYFKDNNIPYCMEPITKTTPHIWYQHEKKAYIRHKEVQYVGLKTTYYYYLPQYKTIKLDPPIRHVTYWVKTIGYRITWWSNKDIGIEYILKSNRMHR
jgi:hypothetical protein